MKSDSFRFGCFTLDVENRLLCRDGVMLDVSSRYLDALVRHAGGLVPKDQFMNDVWRGVPVTDEALTQCIRSLRRVLNDDAARPSFIETVPKHGYRFIALVETGAPEPAKAAPLPNASKLDWRTFWTVGLAGIGGGGVAGLFGGIFYGVAGGSHDMGATSTVLVLSALTVLVALIGAAGVSFGMAAMGLFKPGTGPSTIVGGAAGGFFVGGIVRLLGLDAFSLLLGQSPTHITGALEGAILGAAVGLGVWLGGNPSQAHPLWRRALPAAAVGLFAGVAIPAAGGNLLGGSLNALAEAIPPSRFRLDQIGAPLGEGSFGLISEMATGGLEGMLCAAGVTVAILLAKRRFAE
jgi:DNA-binding winged helix-turn-helix (wHTH) protein